jgi:menaquinone-dependent protoporphyrinogen oxidase
MPWVTSSVKLVVRAVNPLETIEMPDFLIVYASTHGHTAKIASRVAAAVRDGGATAQVTEVSSAREIDPSGYDGVIVGASIHASHHQREIVDWVKGHATALSGMPSAFFSVSLAAAEEEEESRAAAGKYIDDFLDETGWKPRSTASFAGALQYLEYNFATRVLIRLMMKRAGHPTDASQDYDYTDWDAVESFGRDFAELGRASAGTLMG